MINLYVSRCCFKVFMETKLIEVILDAHKLDSLITLLYYSRHMSDFDVCKYVSV